MNQPSIKPISPEDRKLWEKQNLADLLYWADLPFTQKIQMLEDMEEVARAFHGGKLPPSPDEQVEESGKLKRGES
jgi:hypothetical protein